MIPTQLGDDGRLRVLRNEDLLKVHGGEREIHEFEVWADAGVVGDYNAPPYHLGIWELPLRIGSGAPQRFYLRVESAVTPESIGVGSAKWNSNPVGPIAEEFTMLATLFLRRRLRLGAQVREGDTPRWIDYAALYGPVDPALLDGGANLNALGKGFRLLSGLNPALQPPYVLAVRMYHQAVLSVEVAPDLACLHLVSSLEALSRHHDIASVPLEKLDGQLAGLIARVGDEALRAEFEIAIRKRNWHTKRRFIEFVKAHVEDDFWRESTAPEIGRVKEADLVGHLGRIYDQRSTTLHTGAPFPAYLSFSPTRLDREHGPCEIEFAEAMHIGGTSWTRGHYIPAVHFFERLVNHVLQVFVKRNQVPLA